MPRASFTRRGSAKLVVCAVAVVGFAGLAGCDASENADVIRGRELFLGGGQCSQCHALAQAGSSAEVGPDLDASFTDARASGMDSDTIEGIVEAQIANPREVDENDPNFEKTYMPADLVTGQDATDVAAYVASVAGVPGAQPPPLGEPPDVFTELCGSCHTLQAAGTAGTVGPDLDEALQGWSAKEIREAIVNPDAKIAQGYSAGVMPQDFEQQLAEEDALNKLVQYLIDSVGGGSGGNGSGGGGG